MTLKTKVNLIISIAIVVLALPAAALADSGTGNLRVAIDDGTGNSELFVFIDALDDLRHESCGIATGPSICQPNRTAWELRSSVAITSQLDFFLAHGVTIISHGEIDAETQVRVRSLLAAAGHDDVIFVDGKTVGGDTRADYATYVSTNEVSHQSETSNQ